MKCCNNVFNSHIRDSQRGAFLSRGVLRPAGKVDQAWQQDLDKWAHLFPLHIMLFDLSQVFGGLWHDSRDAVFARPAAEWPETDPCARLGERLTIKGSNDLYLRNSKWWPWCQNRQLSCAGWGTILTRRPACVSSCVRIKDPDFAFILSPLLPLPWPQLHWSLWPLVFAHSAILCI